MHGMYGRVRGNMWTTAICGQRAIRYLKKNALLLALLLLNELSHIHLCNDVVVAAVAVVAVVVNNNAANFKFCALIYFYAVASFKR